MTRPRVLVLFALFSTTLFSILPAQEGALEFEPKVGTVGSRVTLKNPLPTGTQVRFGSRTVSVDRDSTGRASFTIPPGALTSFVEVLKDGRPITKSTVPFVVAGSPGPSKLVGLKEAIDVFGYSEARPTGGEKPEPAARPILKFGDDEILTIGEAPPMRLGPAVELGDAASAATRGMGSAGFIITARPPKKKPTPLPIAPPTD